MTIKDKTIVGRTEKIDIILEDIRGVPAKIDTGADTSSIWASEIDVSESGELSFCLFAKGSKFYSGKRHVTKSFDITVVRSAHGSLQIRYRTQLVVRVKGRRVRGLFTLADRSKNIYPILIGCKLLNKKFLVDVSKGYYEKKMPLARELNKELQDDPRGFFERYHLNNERGDFER